MCLLSDSAMELALALEKLVNEKLHNLHGVGCFHMLIYGDILSVLLMSYLEHLWANIN
jgi:hypothetical protein